MLRIGVMADTHLADCKDGRRFLADLAQRHFAAVAMILHAGDIVDPGLLDALAPTPVHAVRGNMDPSTPATPSKRVIDAAGLRIGLIHGWGAPAGMEARLLQEFSGIPLDCLVFGHTHVPCCERRDGVLFFNPGSATERRRMPWESVGMLEVEEGQVNGRIIMLNW